MTKTTTALATPLREQLDRLAAFEPTAWPVLSVYLDLRADEQGRRRVDPFLRKTFAQRSRTLTGEARKSFDRDAQRIRDYVAGLPPAASGAAIFACDAAQGLFETVSLDVPVDHHWLFIGSVPHLYPLARLTDQYPRYAALLVDTNAARLFVFSLGRLVNREWVSNVKTRWGALGGWSQARYQRHLENIHLHHMKDVVAILERVVRDEQIEHIVVACDEVARPLLLEQLSRDLAARVIDVLQAGIHTPEHRILADTLDALRRRDGETDVERVATLLDAWRAGGLGVVGAGDTLDALARRQVEELLIAADPAALDLPDQLPADAAPGPVDIETTAPHTGYDGDRAKLAGELVTRAQQNSARIRFIEDASLLAEVGGVGALLRFRI